MRVRRAISAHDKWGHSYAVNNPLNHVDPNGFSWDFLCLYQSQCHRLFNRLCLSRTQEFLVSTATMKRSVSSMDVFHLTSPIGRRRAESAPAGAMERCLTGRYAQ